MSQDPAQPPDAGKIRDQIRQIQREIFEREDSIAELVKSADPPPRLITVIDAEDVDPRLRHLARLIVDWDMLVARSRAVTEDDIELIAAMIRLIGNLLLIQPDGIDERWISKLQEYLADQRSKVS